LLAKTCLSGFPKETFGRVISTRELRLGPIALHCLQRRRPSSLFIGGLLFYTWLPWAPAVGGRPASLLKSVRPDSDILFYLAFGFLRGRPDVAGREPVLGMGDAAGNFTKTSSWLVPFVMRLFVVYGLGGIFSETLSGAASTYAATKGSNLFLFCLQAGRGLVAHRGNRFYRPLQT